MKSIQSTDSDIEYLKELLKRITFYAKMLVENPESLASPQSNLEGLLRNSFTPEELDDDAIRAILVAITLRRRATIDRLTEDYFLHLIHRHLKPTKFDDTDL